MQNDKKNELKSKYLGNGEIPQDYRRIEISNETLLVSTTGSVSIDFADENFLKNLDEKIEKASNMEL